MNTKNQVVSTVYTHFHYTKMLNGMSNFKQCLKFCGTKYGKSRHSINVNRQCCDATQLFGFQNPTL